MTDIERPSRPGVLAGIAFTGILAGAVVGGTTNAVNGAVSPEYFEAVMRWPPIDIWERAIAQGVFEGLIVGFGLALIFTIATGIITGASCTYRFAAKHLLGIVAATYVCWAIGGMAAMGLATLSPRFYRGAFIGVPDDFAGLLGYAWVGGSIWGAQLGGLASVIVGLFYLRANWRQEASQTSSR